MKRFGRNIKKEEWGKMVRELANVLNRHGLDNALNIPDFLLARFLLGQLEHVKALQDFVEEWKRGTP